MRNSEIMKKQNNKILLFVWIALIIMNACRKDDDKQVNIDYGYDYFGFIENRALVYEVTEINIDDPSGVYDTNRYFLKCVFAEPFKDDEGRNAMKLYNYTSATCADSSWQLSKVYWSVLTNAEAIVYEENIPYVKLSLPIENGKEWDGNKYNDNGEQTYSITKYEDDSIKVSHKDDISLISEDVEYEVYMRGVGLYRKVSRDLEAYYDNIELPIEQRISMLIFMKLSL